MIVAATDPAAHRRANHHLGRMIATGAIAHLGQFIHDLIVGRPDEVGELDLRNGDEPIERHAYGATDDTALTQRRIDHTIFPEFIEQLLRDAEYATHLADV